MEQGLLSAWLLDGEGGGRELDWAGVRDWRPEMGVLWIHLHYPDERARHWVADESGIDPVVAAALLAEETRPRATALPGGLLAVLRGANLNPGAEPEDMLSIRMWLTEQRIVTTRMRHLLSVEDIRQALRAGRGPRGPGEFLVAMGERLAARMSDVVEGIHEGVDDLEEAVLNEPGAGLRGRLAEQRRRIIALRRYLAPQREAVSRLAGETAAWLGDPERIRLREVADRFLRYVEDLDAARERAAVTQEELASRQAEQMNSRVYLLSIVAALFLPLGFVTGLLGVNVGGIPGADNHWGFAVVSVLLLATLAVQLWLFRRRRWL